MLTQETKRKIDSARQILVGKVPDPKAQVEQITTALIYKFMDDMDKEAIELGGKARFFTNGFQKYAWTKLLDPKLGGHERLELYGEAVTRMSQNPHIPQLFRDIFKDAFLPYRSPETLTLFLKEINGFTYNHSEELGNAFEYLLSILGSQGDAGQFRTPRHIIDFIVDVIEPKKSDTILDPACGTAGFLISAYKNILKQQKDKPLTPDEKKKLMNNLVGYDISPDMVKLSKVNMYLHGFAEPKIFEYDTLSSDEKWDESFDVIMANPPFMSPQGGIRPHKRFSVQANRAEVLFVDYIKEHLRPNGRAGIIVPEGIIFQSSGAYKQLRKILVEDGLFAVVSLPQGVFNPYAGVKTSILFFDNTIAKKTDKILFVRVLNDGFDLGAQRRPIDRNDLIRPDNEVDATKVLKGQRIAIETGTKNPWLQENSLFAHEISKEQIAQSGDYNLSAERYRLDNLGEKKNYKWPIIELKKLEDKKQIIFLRGEGVAKKDIVPDGKYMCIRYGEIYTTYQPVITQVVSRTNYEGKVLSKVGDVLVPATTTADAMGIAVARALDKDGVVIGGDINIIRTENKIILSKYLAYLISNSPLKKELAVYAKGANILHLSNNDLRKLKIPLPPIEVQKEIVEQIEVKQNAIEHAKAIIENLERERRYFGQSLRKLGDIPMTELSKLTSINNGYVLSKFDNDKNIACIKVSDMNLEENKTEIVTTSHWLKETKLSLLPVRSVIFPKRGAAIATNKKRITRMLCLIDNNCMALTVKDENVLLPEYLFAFLQGFDLTTISNSAGVALINNGDINSVKIPLPSLEIQKRMIEEMEKEGEIIASNRKLIEVMEKKIGTVLSEI
ncbi:MAG: N-6 DNA methylase [Patescibacteria group bacterium]|nr:N-6 DNA methylase [Patescibacteria group bacterium]MDE1945635.1 N-6 DNA methylase [Patescibacteria group bacterium]